MVVHELATNSVKYGALSCADGFLDISSRQDGDILEIIWVETRGPEVGQMPDLQGFGRKLVKRSVTNQLGGELHYDWRKAGLVVTIKVLVQRLAS